MTMNSSNSNYLIILYTITTISSLLLISTCLAHKPVYQTITRNFLTRPKLSFISSLVTEYSIYILFSKMLLIYQLSGQHFFKNALTSRLYYLDLVIMLQLWALFLQAVFSRHPIYEATKFMRNSASTCPPSIFTWSFWFRFSNPFWMSRTLLIHQDVLYASQEEIKALKLESPLSQRLLSLDVFQHPSFPKNCPVVMYIHGGQWKSGQKEDRPPLFSFLALKKYVVVSINHRLAPSVTVKDQLIDVKRAIRWVKENIQRFGGDPEFICITGSCSGAHLAMMACMTMNEGEYQPGFEGVDTTLQACCSIAGFYDVTRNWGYRFSYKFEKKITQEENGDSARLFSPTWRLKEAEANKVRINATEEEIKGPFIPPLLVIHGSSDCMAPISHVKEFIKQFNITTSSRPGSQVTLIELSGCGHDFSAWSTPRSHMIPYGIEPFLCREYEKYLLDKKAE